MSAKHTIPDGAVMLSEALAAIKYYRDSLKGTPEPHIYAYLIKHHDLMPVLGIKSEPNMLYQECRGYIGKTELDGIIDWHLYIVPVDNSADQFDVIPETTDGIKYVYNFNTPCPATCDTSSPLYLV